MRALACRARRGTFSCVSKRKAPDDLHNETAMHIVGTWPQKPSTHNEFVAMFTNFSPVELFDENGNATGVSLGPGQVIPIPPALYLFGSGLLGLIGMARRKKA